MDHAHLPRWRRTWQRLRRDSTPGAALAGFVAILIGWTGPNILIYNLAGAAHLDGATATSWLWTHAIATGLVSIVLSLRFRQPIISTWSTPGIAFLIGAMPGYAFSDAIGAFLVSGALVFACGLLPRLMRWFERMPLPLAAALNAAILLPFVFKAVQALSIDPPLVAAMFAAFFVARQRAPRWAVAAVLAVAVVAGFALGAWHPRAIAWGLTTPRLVAPTFSLDAAVNLALPLTVLAFTGQFLPGFGVLETNRYRVHAAPIVRSCGVASMASAFFGCHSITLGAMIANVVCAPQAHPRRDRRYTAAVWAGAINLVLGMFAATLLDLMSVLPAAAIAALAGVALLGATASSLRSAFDSNAHGLAAALVLAITLSGVNWLGIGAAFWGVVAGLLVQAVERWVPVRAAAARR